MSENRYDFKILYEKLAESPQSDLKRAIQQTQALEPIQALSELVARNDEEPLVYFASK